MSPSTIETELQAWGVTSTAAQRQRLETYRARLGYWSRSMNLTSLEGGRLIRRLIVEPLWVFGQLQPAGRYVDIGSGNGSPAFPWLSSGTLHPARLIEARKKRAVFLRQTCYAMGLFGCEVYAGRFSDFLRARAAADGSPDWITIQGVKPGPELWSEINRIRGEQTRIVWFTGATAATPETPVAALALPGSTRHALIFSRIRS